MLPITRVVLYKHGVGYFERQGRVEGDASLDLHFKAAEMNDVLKSLTVLDLTSGVISSISYESTKPVEKQLEDIAIRIPDENALTGLLAQLKGARVALEVAQRTVEGVVTGVERVRRRVNQETVATHYLSVLVEGAHLQSYDLLEIKRLSFLDESLRKDLQHLLDILISAKKKDLKKLTIFARGEGERDIQASYLVEMPVWKTSYRMLLSAKAPTVVQGWALVDNTQDEDWDDVRLSLVAGLPISFVHDLYSPRYKRRPVVEVREEEAYAPPVLEHASMDLGSMPECDSAPEPCMSAPSGMAFGAIGGPGGGGGGLSRSRQEARAQSNQVQTRTAEVGDLFSYEITNPVTVKRNQSALVPILQTPTEGARVAVYNPEVRSKNPMSAVLFKNTTGLTLEGGPVTVLEDETYVGESMLETMKPGEERLMPFSVELGCEIVVDDQSELQAVHRAQISGGYLYLYRYRLSKKIYDIDNRTERPLDLFFEHRFAPGWKLVDTEEPVEKTEHFLRFKVKAPARKRTKFKVTEKGDETETFGLASVNREQIVFWLEHKYVDVATRKVLDGLVELQERATTLQADLARLEQEQREIDANQARVRQNLQALGSSQDERGLRDRYVADLAAEEDRVGALKKDLKRLRGERAAIDADLRKRLRTLEFQATL